MTLKASLLRQIENPTLTANQRAQLRCQLAGELEETGNYEDARQAMGDLWQRVGEKPNVEDLDRDTAAEVLLRAGVLTGWIGSLKQIKDAQETAKNLISESVTIFDSLSYAKRILEAQTELAYCYWRQGAYDEARIVLRGVIERLTADNDLKAKAVLRSAIVERSAIHYSDALRILTDYASMFDKIHNHTIKGGYHNELGLVFKNLAESERREDYIDRAFMEYTAAAFHFEQIGHKPYCALVENNLGFLFFNADRFTEAHEHLDRARRLFSYLKDYCSVAQVEDTRARAYLAQGYDTEAETAARAAVVILEKCGRQSLLAEALTTHGTALARLGYHEPARFNLFRAVEVAHQSGALNDAGLAALTIIEELSAHLSLSEMQDIYERAYRWLEPSQHHKTLHRLLRAANRVLTYGREEASRQSDEEAEKSYDLREVVRQFESKLIKQALEASHGSVTQAARMLGITHQSLASTLQRRHRDLMNARTPVVKRKRSIIKRRD